MSQTIKSSNIDTVITDTNINMQDSVFDENKDKQLEQTTSPLHPNTSKSNTSQNTENVTSDPSASSEQIRPPPIRPRKKGDEMRVPHLVLRGQ